MTGAILRVDSCNTCKNFILFNPFLNLPRLQQHGYQIQENNMLKLLQILFTGLLVCSTAVEAKIDLVTLPARDKTQLTIYNSADLTLVREQRTLTLKKGLNRLEFGWENTLIDPTSVQLYAPGNENKVRLLEVNFPANITGSAVWSIESDIDGPVPVEITFFTSGLSWQAFYMGTLSKDEQHMQLDGYVTIRNHSGEDYENASTRVIVGKIHLLDEIMALAGRDSPYNRPGKPQYRPLTKDEPALKMKAYRAMGIAEDMAVVASMAPKAIVKEGLSEYFLYGIEGTENIPDGWGKRLPSFSVEKIPVKNLYRYEEERYGKATQRLMIFKNDDAHLLGKEPLPDGNIKVFKQVSKDLQLGYVGHVNSKYIPIGQEVELDFGAARDVKIEPLLMTEKSDNYRFNRNGDVSGFDRKQQWEIKLENNRDMPIRIEVFRNFNTPHWEIKNSDKNKGKFEKVDIDTVKYTLDIPAYSTSALTYAITYFEGERQTKH
jgi:hypothetical protein